MGACSPSGMRLAGAWRAHGGCVCVFVCLSSCMFVRVRQCLCVASDVAGYVASLLLTWTLAAGVRLFAVDAASVNIYEYINI